MRWYAVGSLLSDVTEWTLGCLLPILSCLSCNKKLQQKPSYRFFGIYCNFGRWLYFLCKNSVCANIPGGKDGHASWEDFMESNICPTLTPTCATTTLPPLPPPEKLNLLDLNYKFGKKAGNIFLQFQVQISIDDHLSIAAAALAQCSPFIYITHMSSFITRGPCPALHNKVFRLCAKTEMARYVEKNTIKQISRWFSEKLCISSSF